MVKYCNHLSPYDKPGNDINGLFMERIMAVLEINNSKFVANMENKEMQLSDLPSKIVLKSWLSIKLYCTWCKDDAMFSVEEVLALEIAWKSLAVAALDSGIALKQNSVIFFADVRPNRPGTGYKQRAKTTNTKFFLSRQDSFEH